jgi:TRAP-type C4-dicarboxylate transport system substrate-binding protein
MEAMMRARTRWLTAISLAATIVAGCGNASGPAPSADPGAKAGGKPGPIAITVADSQPNNKPSNLPLDEFKRHVEQLSGGAITVTILANAVEDVAPGSDAAVIDKVKSGAFQMAVVPARAWSDAGVTSLKALQAPFLFESDEHVAAVVNDPAITKDLFNGFEGSGLTGLTLFPESLRHLFSFGAPMLTPADVKGKPIRAISSQETTAIIGALGGTAVDPAGDAYERGVDAGTIHGTDSGFVLAAGGNPSANATATGNVALYANVMTLVINSALWTGLDDAQRVILTTASDATRAWAIANQVTDAAAAAKFCAGGGTVVLADTAAVDAFRAAEAPVYAALEADPAAKRAIAAIGARAPTTSTAAVVKACEQVIDATTLVPDGGDLPNGIYRIEFTDEYLTTNGVKDLREEHGVWTFRLEDGQWTMDQVADNPLRNSHLSGEYQVKGQELFWTIDNDSSGSVDDLVWSVSSRGDLSFTSAPGAERNWWFGLPWARVGDVAAGPGSDRPVLDGIYRYEVTERYMLDHGLEASHARNESGVHTLTMSDGEFTDAWVNGVADGSCSGVFTIDGPRVTLRWTRGCTGDTRATYERVGDVLHWTQVESLPPHDSEYDQKVNEAFWGVPYTRIGDAP